MNPQTALTLFAIKRAANASNEPAPAPTQRFALFATAAALASGCALPISAEAAAYIKFDGVDGGITPAPLIIPFDQFVWLQVSAGGHFEPRADRPMEAISDGYPAMSFNQARSVSFVFTNGDASAAPYFVIDLLDVRVTSDDTSSQAGGPHTRVFDGYSGATLYWLPPATANNPTPTALTAHWNTADGSFSGALESLGGFNAIGALTRPDGTISFTSAVPEPGTWGLGLAGLSAVLAVVRRRSAASAMR